MGIRSTIVFRIAVVYFILLLFGAVVVFKLISVQKIKNDRLVEIENNLKKHTIIEEPIRGNICADDGSVLATTVPGYYVRIDLAAPGVRKVYSKESDSLAYYLSNFFKDASRQEYNRRLNAAYRNKNRGFMLTPRKINSAELKIVKNFPIIRRGQFAGGRLIDSDNIRINPLDGLALRTIGGINKGAYGGVHGPIGYTGIEDAYESYLKGKDGISYKQNLSGRWVTRVEIQPKDGMEIITTLNVKLQDIAENALLRQLNKSNAEWGTIILMEVETGEIKAIANLGKGTNGYFEKDNYAIGHRGSFEPGSTFKLVSLMAAMEDGVIDTSDVFDTGNGYWLCHGKAITDTEAHGVLTVKQIFEQSSNIGVAKIITKYYENKQKEYVDRVYSFGINKPLNVDLKGEGQPVFRYPGESGWSGTTLSRMSYGYETKMTPLQILTFYNAVANDGKMVRPRLVNEIRDNGVLHKKFKTEVINPMIASKETIGKAKKLLEGVCEYGTGRSLQNEFFKVAGKTGTARIANERGYDDGEYLASFAGYFPADKPRYSMIVTFNSPENSIYGASVAGPVFKEISTKVFAAKMLYEDSDDKQPTEENRLPKVKKGRAEDIMKVAKKFDIENITGVTETQMVYAEIKNENIVLKENEIQSGIVPNVIGMGASNAVFLLENAGLSVKVKGVGKVASQSIKAGSKYRVGQTVYLTLG